MTDIRTEGIILHAIPFKEADQILTILTPEGIIKLIYKGGLSRRRSRGTAVAPLQLAECVYAKTRGELSSCKEMRLLNAFLGLRKRLESLEGAGEMAAAVLSTQHPDVPSLPLYRLLHAYLENLPTAADPFLLAASFKLKLLRHEGILSLQEECSECGAPLNAFYLSGGEVFCREHAPGSAVPFTHDESALLLECALGRSIGRMKELTAPPPFLVKVRRLFKEAAR